MQTLTQYNPQELQQISEITKLILQDEEYKTLMSYYRGALMEIETKFKVLNEFLAATQDRNPIETVKSRIKSPKSIIEKLWRKELPFTVQSIEKNIRDVAGVRVICGFPEDVYLLAEYLLKQDDITLVRVKDYIKSPKQTGYRSLHLIVQVPIFLANEKRMMNVEIQLRTIAMDFWASLEHKMQYKKNDLKHADEIAEELKVCASEIAKMDLMMQNIRNRIDDKKY